MSESRARLMGVVAVLGLWSLYAAMFVIAWKGVHA